MTRFLGIDIGTTFLKGAILDLDRGTIATVSRRPMPEPVEGLPATRHELDPHALVAAVRGLLSELSLEAPDATGLVTCSQMHGVVLCDDRGNPRTNAITWKDQRALEPGQNGAGSEFDVLKQLVTDDDRQREGNEVRVGVPITTLFCLRPRGSLYPAAIPDFVLSNLCGVEPTTDPTNAAAHGLFDLDAGDWHRELIARLGLASLRWPRIRRFGEVVGEVSIDGRRLACFTPVGDQQCALAGVGLREGELSLNISTGSQASLVTRDRPRGDFQVRPYFDGTWLRTLVQIPAGRSLAVLVDLLTELGSAGDPWGAIGKAVDAVPVTDLEIDLGFFGTAAGGRIGNIREGNLTVGHLFAAAFREMAANYARCAAVLSPDRGWRRVVFSGGLAQKFPRLRAESHAALGHPPHRLCPTEEDTLHGLLALALVCSGRAATVADATATLNH